MSEKAVSVQNVNYRYPFQNKQCLEGINLDIIVGERFGLFGPNGAGKTTLLSLMTGLFKLQTGSISLMEHPVGNRKEINALFGYVPQEFSFYEELTATENLDFFGTLSGLTGQQLTSRITELMEILGLISSRKKRVQQFSGGMKRRVNLAIGVIHNPKILFLDEPTVGVDIQTRHQIIEFLKNLNNEGTTLVYTSHLLREAEELCNKVALIDEGKIIEHQTIEELLVSHNEVGLEGLFLKLTGKTYRDN
jgi:ABC-2 type transport system ATP-binding protein